jgi:hypothetical protein
MSAGLQRRVEKLESLTGKTAACPRCGRPADAGKLAELDPHRPKSPEELAERRRLRSLTPAELDEEYRAVFGYYPGERPSPPDDEVFQPTCSRCGNPTGPAMTWGQVRALPQEDLMRLVAEAQGQGGSRRP